MLVDEAVVDLPFSTALLHDRNLSSYWYNHPTQSRLAKDRCQKVILTSRGFYDWLCEIHSVQYHTTTVKHQCKCHQTLNTSMQTPYASNQEIESGSSSHSIMSIQDKFLYCIFPTSSRLGPIPPSTHPLHPLQRYSPKPRPHYRALTCASCRERTAHDPPPSHPPPHL